LYFTKQPSSLNATDTLKQGEPEFTLYAYSEAPIELQDIIIVNNKKHLIKSKDFYDHMTNFNIYTLKYVDDI
jgi:hypothetical protein